jgi:hypothetical protein
VCACAGISCSTLKEQGQLVDGTADIVEIAQVDAQLRDADEHHGQHQLRGHQLPQGQLPLDHQPAAEAEQRRAGQRVDEQEAQGLGEVVAKMRSCCSI